MQCAYEVVVTTKEKVTKAILLSEGAMIHAHLNKGFRFFFRALILDVKEKTINSVFFSSPSRLCGQKANKLAVPLSGVTNTLVSLTPGSLERLL